MSPCAGKGTAKEELRAAHIPLKARAVLGRVVDRSLTDREERLHEHETTVVPGSTVGGVHPRKG